MGHNRNVGYKKGVVSYAKVYKSGYDDGYKEGLRIRMEKGNKGRYRRAAIEAGVRGAESL